MSDMVSLINLVKINFRIIMINELKTNSYSKSIWKKLFPKLTYFLISGSLKKLRVIFSKI